MKKKFKFTETVIISVEPERASRVADECLVDMRVVEFRKDKSGWIYEYEVQGEFGNVEKFRTRIKYVETMKTF